MELVTIRWIEYNLSSKGETGTWTLSNADLEISTRGDKVVEPLFNLPDCISMLDSLRSSVVTQFWWKLYPPFVVLIQVIDFLFDLIEGLKGEAYMFSEYESSILFPCLVEKVCIHLIRGQELFSWSYCQFNVFGIVWTLLHSAPFTLFDQFFVWNSLDITSRRSVRKFGSWQGYYAPSTRRRKCSYIWQSVLSPRTTARGLSALKILSLW